MEPLPLPPRPAPQVAEGVGGPREGQAGQSGAADAAFDGLARAAMPRLLGTARRWLGQGFAAEEAVAEALYRAFVHRAGFNGQAAFSTWVHRILCRVVADRYRTLGRERRHRAHLEREAVSRPVPPPGASAADRERIEEVRRAMEQLPERQRVVLWLHAWEGLDLHALSEVLGIRYATAKSNLHHARVALERLLELP